jgi:hypothetical protein
MGLRHRQEAHLFRPTPGGTAELGYSLEQGGRPLFKNLIFDKHLYAELLG